MLKAVVLSILFSFVLLGCGSDDNSKGKEIIGETFSDPNMQFSGGVPLFVAIIKLRNPALLSTAVKTKTGVYKFDESLKERILSEQEDIELKLKGISSDIKIIYRYKRVLNAIAVEAPQKYADQIMDLPVDFIESNQNFEQPNVLQVSLNEDEPKKIGDKTSMTAVGVDKIHNLLKVLNKEGKLIPVKGKGVKIGIIDTGIDYTHKMFGGTGDRNEYTFINPDKPHGNFPNAKVVGGRDFVGAHYNSNSHIYKNHVPVPDENPIDYGGHGTHVAGTTAGVGDGINTYDGAAPEADLYALKVFGDEGGSTADTVVIAALEYAADPNEDYSLEDKLDVLNLSLGGGYGEEHSLYTEALDNLLKTGTLSVISAGNSGAKLNIVGAPSSADAALSVAASIDYMSHNIEFRALNVQTENADNFNVDFVEGSFSKKLSKISELKEGSVYIGLADEPLTAEQKAALKGKIALIDRGKISFVEKVQAAITGGAIGVVVINNEEGVPFVMGIKGKLKEPLIPSVMVSQAVGERIKSLLKSQEVTIDLKSDEIIVKTELIDTITSFSSQGPRSGDAGLKPEITAPGKDIISASAGTGSKGVKFSGTSMSAPHVAGIAALLIQYRRDLKASEIKSLIMNTSKDMFDENDKQYPISRKGAGLIQAYKAATSKFSLKRPSIALGNLSVKNKRIFFKKIKIKNITDKPLMYSFSAVGDESLKFSFAKDSVSLAPGEEQKVKIEIQVEPTDQEVSELNSFVEIRVDGSLEGRLPVLAIVKGRTSMSVTKVKEVPFSLLDMSRKEYGLRITNKGNREGEALIFNLLDVDKRKVRPEYNTYTSACDLESAGYRIVERTVEKTVGKKQVKKQVKFFQVAVKVYNPVTGWQMCDVQVDFDYNADGVPEQRLIGSTPKDWLDDKDDATDDDTKFHNIGLSSLLFDAKIFDAIETAYKNSVSKQPAAEPKLRLLPALQFIEEFKSYRSSTLAIVEAPLEGLQSKDVARIKVSVSYNNEHNVERLDVLSDADTEWKDVSFVENKAGFYKMPESVVVKPKMKPSIGVLKGDKIEDLVVYFPRNKFTKKEKGNDKQSQIIKWSDIQKVKSSKDQ